MPLGLRFEFEDGPVAHAEMHETHAPTSCRVLWEALSVPVTMLATHAMYAGPEIMMNLAEEARTFSPTDIPAENQQVVPSAGDVIWYYQAPNLMAGLTDEVWEVGLFYGSGGRIFGASRMDPMQHHCLGAGRLGLVCRGVCGNSPERRPQGDPQQDWVTAKAAVHLVIVKTNLETKGHSLTSRKRWASAVTPILALGAAFGVAGRGARR